MEVFEAVRTRRSASSVLADHPSAEEVERLLALAMNAPDHGRLRPWRLVLVTGDARTELGRALAEAAGAWGTDAERLAAKPLRAPLLIGIVLCPRQNAKVPEWEQLAATVGVVTTLCLLLHAEGWAAMWRTGRHLDAEPVRGVMDVDGDERLLGWLYVGGADPGVRRPPERVITTEGRLTVLDPRVPDYESAAVGPDR